MDNPILLFINCFILLVHGPISSTACLALYSAIRRRIWVSPKVLAMPSNTLDSQLRQIQAMLPCPRVIPRKTGKTLLYCTPPRRLRQVQICCEPSNLLTPSADG